MARFLGCILLKFYIKPQRMDDRLESVVGCILLKFYIKPQLAAKRFLVLFVVSY